MKYSAIIFLLILQVLSASLLFGQDTQSVFEALDQALQKEYGGKFGFSVLVADEKKILFSNSYGHIDTSKTKKVNQETLFHIASITKSVTAIGIFQLIEKQKLALDDTIGKFFENVPRDKHSIRVSHLLTHRSGFEQNYVCFGIGNSDDAVSALLNDTLSSLPGTDFKYSNQNFELLALIIEKITGSTYEDYIRKNILQPLDMKGSFFWNEINGKENVAGKNQEFPDSLLARNWDYIGANGIYTNPSELYKFIKGVIENQLISENSTESLLSEQYRATSGLSICYGWFKNDSTTWNTKEIWTRGSQSWGHNAVIRWFPDKKKVIIVCTNSGEIGEKQSTGNRMISNYIADFLFK